MSKLKKIIKPTILYDKNNKPDIVKITKEDFDYFIKTLTNFSEQAKKIKKHKKIKY